MYKFTGFSAKADTALNGAILTAQELGHTYIGSEHLLISLAEDTTSVAGVVLSGRNVTAAALLKRLRSEIGAGLPTELEVEDISPRLKKIIETALAIGSRSELLAGTEHLLCAILRERSGAAVRLLNDLGVSQQTLLGDVNRALAPDTAFQQTPHKGGQGKNERETLMKYSVDLTKAAREGKIDPVACREKEIDRVLRILCRRTKNDPCLIGEPGVGKTAIAEGLALKIAEGDVPDALKDKELFSLELTGMVAGAKYRGDFEERIRNVVNEVTAAGNVILFIDEIHNLIGAGAAEGAVDAANILKPMLARGELRIIGATTIDEYRKTIARDAALERRFQTVTVEEPSKEEAREILHTLKSRYEAHHGCTITEEALTAAVELSDRYINDRFLPDKAIDLIDEAAAKVCLNAEEKLPGTAALKEKLNALNTRKTTVFSSGDDKLIATLLTEEKELKAELAEKKLFSVNKTAKPVVTAADVSAVVSEWTDIPVSRLTEGEKEKLSRLEEELSRRVIGQPDAVKAVAEAVIRGRTGMKDPKRPLGTFLFCGPTGVGKTELSKALAEALFGSEKAMIRLDMSEYAEKHSVSRLIGSPPGYVGFEEGGHLTEQIRRHPYSVILFDEIEKAHPDIFNTLLQMLEDGILTASDGRTANCRNCILIMTSNVGDTRINERLPELGFSFAGEEASRAAIVRAVNTELKRVFRPEFLNRIDSTVIFGKLKKEDIAKIAANQLREVRERAAKAGINVHFTEEFIQFCAEKNHSDKNGARDLRRYITDEIENRLAKLLLSNEDIKELTVGVKEGKVETKRKISEAESINRASE